MSAPVIPASPWWGWPAVNHRIEGYYSQSRTNRSPKPLKPQQGPVQTVGDPEKNRDKTSVSASRPYSSARSGAFHSVATPGGEFKDTRLPSSSTFQLLTFRFSVSGGWKWRAVRHARSDLHSLWKGEWRWGGGSTRVDREISALQPRGPSLAIPKRSPPIRRSAAKREQAFIFWLQLPLQGGTTETSSWSVRARGEKKIVSMQLNTWFQSIFFEVSSLLSGGWCSLEGSRLDLRPLQTQPACSLEYEPYLQLHIK